MDPQTLIEQAAALAKPFAPSADVTSGSVAASLLSRSGKVYTGVCIDSACSLGFCAEHAAAAEMLKARESHVEAVVAVTSSGEILPPCGRCRELLWQVDERNRDARVILGPDRSVSLAELLPQRSRAAAAPI